MIPTIPTMMMWRGRWILAGPGGLDGRNRISHRVSLSAQATPPPRLKILVADAPTSTSSAGGSRRSNGAPTTLEQINGRLQDLAREINVELVTVQSNHEGVLVDTFQKHMDDVDGGMINAAGLTFSSVSLHDVIKAMPFPVIEVHISNLATRDEIHQQLDPHAGGARRGDGPRLALVHGGAAGARRDRPRSKIEKEAGADKAARTAEGLRTYR